MIQRDRYKLIGAIVACFLVFGYLAGCGSTSEPLIIGNNNPAPVATATVVPTPGPTVPLTPTPTPTTPANPDPNFVNPAAIGPGPGPALQTVGTSNILINYVLARAIPTTTTVLEYSGFTQQGYLTYTENSPRQSQVRLAGVPANVSRLQIDLISNGALIGRAVVPLQLTQGQTTTISDPNFQDISGAPLDLAGRYFVSGAEPTATRPGSVKGEFSLNSSGSVTGGTLTLAGAAGGADLVFNVTGGNITMQPDRKFSGTLIATPFNLTLNGVGSLSGALSATATGGPAAGTVVDRVAMLIHCQKSITEASAASLNGTYRFAAAHVGTARTGFSNGNFQLNGSGEVSGGTLTHVDPSVGTLTITGGNYTVLADGAVTLNLNTSNATYILNGSVGNTGNLVVSGRAAIDHVFLIATRGVAFGCDTSDLGTSPRTVGLVVNQFVYYSDLQIDPQGTVKSGSVAWFDKTTSDPLINPVTAGSFKFNSTSSIDGTLKISPIQLQVGQTVNLSLSQGFSTSDKRIGLGTGVGTLGNDQVLPFPIRGFAISNKI